MMILESDLDIKCDNCGHIFRKSKNDIEVDRNIYPRGEYGMGDEYEYYFHDYTQCEHCGNLIEFQLVGYEYPVGCHAGEGESQISGGEFIKIPRVIVSYQQLDFDSDVTLNVISNIEQLIIEIDKNPKMIYEIHPRIFEEVIEKLFQEQGFETKLTPPTRDGGRDIIATKMLLPGKPIVLYIECKRYAEKNSVGVGILRSLYGVQTSDRINQSILVTTGHVSSDAKRFVEKQGTLMSIISFEEILELISKSAQKNMGAMGTCY